MSLPLYQNRHKPCDPTARCSTVEAFARCPKSHMGCLHKCPSPIRILPFQLRSLASRDHSQIPTFAEPPDNTRHPDIPQRLIDHHLESQRWSPSPPSFVLAPGCTRPSRPWPTGTSTPLGTARWVSGKFHGPLALCSESEAICRQAVAFQCLAGAIEQGIEAEYTVGTRSAREDELTRRRQIRRPV